jgi:hypothetical protein
MKRTFLMLLAAGALCVFSCNPKDEKKGKGKDDTVQVERDEDNPGKDEDDTESTSDVTKAANALCDCFNKNVSDMNPQMKKILIKAGKSDNPMQALQTELMKIEDEEKRNEMAQDFQKWSENKEMEECGDNIKKKYKVKDKDPKVQREMLAALEDNSDCTVLAAMLKMAMKMKGDEKTNDDTDGDQ